MQGFETVVDEQANIMRVVPSATLRRVDAIISLSCVDDRDDGHHTHVELEHLLKTMELFAPFLNQFDR